LEEVNKVYEELWNYLHPQGDVGIASYYAVPHMVRIAKEKGLIDCNVLGLVSIIKIQRHKKNPILAQVSGLEKRARLLVPFVWTR